MDRGIFKTCQQNHMHVKSSHNHTHTHRNDLICIPPQRTNQQERQHYTAVSAAVRVQKNTAGGQRSDLKMRGSVIIQPRHFFCVSVLLTGHSVFVRVK